MFINMVHNKILQSVFMPSKIFISHTSFYRLHTTDACRKLSLTSFFFFFFFFFSFYLFSSDYLQQQQKYYVHEFCFSRMNAHIKTPLKTPKHTKTNKISKKMKKIKQSQHVLNLTRIQNIFQNQQGN